jgi:hypothetical protein
LPTDVTPAKAGVQSFSARPRASGFRLTQE